MRPFRPRLPYSPSADSGSQHDLLQPAEDRRLHARYRRALARPRGLQEEVVRHDSRSADGDGPAGAAAATTAPTAAPAAAPSATQAAGFSQAKLQPALMAMDKVNALIGASPQVLRDKTTDPQLPFSSVPSMGAALISQNVSLLYNSYQSAAQPPAGRPFAAQITVQGYPSVNNATTAFMALRTAWQANLFQNLQQLAPLTGAWQESFCQFGNFASASGGPATQWYVCMARFGPYIVTVSIGGFVGLDANSVSQVVRAYYDDALRAVQ